MEPTLRRRPAHPVHRPPVDLLRLDQVCTTFKIIVLLFYYFNINIMLEVSISMFPGYSQYGSYPPTPTANSFGPPPGGPTTGTNEAMSPMTLTIRK